MKQLQLDLFPELDDIKVSNDFFRIIGYNRKTEDYRKAIDIARLLLLNYHPDLSFGRNNVLALMFDMNDVWETWVTGRIAFISEASYNGSKIKAQTKKIF